MSPCRSLLVFSLAWCLPTVFPWVVSVLWICLLSIHFLLHRTTTRRRLGSDQMWAGLPGLLLIVSLTLSQRLFFSSRIGNNNTHLTWLWEGLGQVQSVPDLQEWHLSIGTTAFLCHLSKQSLSFPEEAVHFPRLLLCAQLTQGNVDLLKSLRKVPTAMFSSRKSQGLVCT